jgi:hypothetical protein
MTEKKFQKLRRVIRQRPLNDQEAARVLDFREAILKDCPEAIARFRARQAAQKLLAECKEVRLASEMTIQQVAERTGMDPANLAKLESGQRENPTLETLFRFADGVGRKLELTLKRNRSS